MSLEIDANRHLTRMLHRGEIKTLLEDTMQLCVTYDVQIELERTFRSQEGFAGFSDNMISCVMSERRSK